MAPGRHNAAWAITGDVVCPRGGNAEATQRGIACARKGKVLFDDAEVPHCVAAYIAIKDA